LKKTLKTPCGPLKTMKLKFQLLFLVRGHAPIPYLIVCLLENIREIFEIGVLRVFFTPKHAIKKQKNCVTLSKIKKITLNLVFLASP
jgi:hypothetical protein